MSDAQWAAPGVPFSRPRPGPAADVALLAAAVDEVLGVDPSLVAPETAVARAEVLLAMQDRLAAAGLRAVADVDARDLWQLRSTGSTRTWLRTLPYGDRGQLAVARLLADRPLLSAALAQGSVALRTAAAVARQLARVPGHVEHAQLAGVLVDGLGDLLGVWAGAACLEPTAEQEAEFERRREQLADAVRAGLEDACSDAAGRLEPALVLAAQVLAPADVEAGLEVLVDALQPEADVEALAEQEHRARGVVLRKLKGGGWSLRAHLTDEVGQLTHDALTARLRKHPLEPDAPLGAGDAAASEGDGDQTDEKPDEGERFGAAGPGSPVDATEPAVQGTPLPSMDQRLHDALGQLLADLVDVRPGSGAPAPAGLTVTASVDALQGRPGAPPGRMRTSRGDVPLGRSQLRNLACRSVLSAVLLDAHKRPVGASGSHRHATTRERRTMHAAWGRRCAVNGCSLPGAIPHHAEPFWISGQTKQADLVPVCEHHHHDVHEGHKTLRLRDGRLLDEWGWVSATRTSQARRAG